MNTGKALLGVLAGMASGMAIGFLFGAGRGGKKDALTKAIDKIVESKFRKLEEDFREGSTRRLAHSFRKPEPVS
jgi:hypothetical protein